MFQQLWRRNEQSRTRDKPVSSLCPTCKSRSDESLPISVGIAPAQHNVVSVVRDPFVSTIGERTSELVSREPQLLECTQLADLRRDATWVNTHPEEEKKEEEEEEEEEVVT